VPTEGVTAQHPPDTQPGAAQGAVLADGLGHVGRAGGAEAAGTCEQR
jgi:hypothetical protein